VSGLAPIELQTARKALPEFTLSATKLLYVGVSDTMLRMK